MDVIPNVKREFILLIKLQWKQNKNVKCSSSFALQVEKHCCTYYPMQAQKILRFDWSKICFVRAKCFLYYLTLRVWWRRDGHTHLAITSKNHHTKTTQGCSFADIPEASDARYNANRTGQNWLSDTLFKILSATLVSSVSSLFMQNRRSVTVVKPRDA